MSVAMIGPKFYAWAKNGKPLAFGKLYTYQARTNTPKDTYKSEDQITKNTNPVILNGEGYADIYLSGSYKMVMKDEDENEIWTSDPVSSAQPSEWVVCLSTTYLSPTSFKVGGNFTAQYEVGRRVRIDNGTAEFSYTTILSSSFSASETTITVSDPVVTTGIVESCISIVGPNSLGTASDTSKAHNFETATLMKASLINFPIGKELRTLGLLAVNDGRGASYVVSNDAPVSGDEELSNGDNAQFMVTGSKTIRVDTVGDAGPFLQRKLNTTANISLYVSQGSGSDTNDGLTSGTAFQTINRAIQELPQNIYHGVRVYVLDGDYTSEQVRIYNYFVNARKGAGGSLYIWGHVANYQGEAHPIYNTDDNSAVKLGRDFVVKALSGTDQFAIIGFTFKDAWYQPIDCLTRIWRCHFQGGINDAGYNAKICIGGHSAIVRLQECTFSDIACVADAIGDMHVTAEGCEILDAMVDSPALPGTYGMPFRSSGQSRVLIKNSPTLINGGFNGKRNVAENDGVILNEGGYTYSELGANLLGRGDPRADEDLQIQGGNGNSTEQARGSGIALYGRNHATRAGWAQVDFGPSSGAKCTITYSDGSTVKEAFKVTSGGNTVATGYSVISTTAESVLDELEDGRAGITVSANGDVMVFSQVGGVVKYTIIHDYSTATPL